MTKGGGAVGGAPTRDDHAINVMTRSAALCLRSECAPT